MNPENCTIFSLQTNNLCHLIIYVASRLLEVCLTIMLLLDRRKGSSQFWGKNNIKQFSKEPGNVVKYPNSLSEYQRLQCKRTKKGIKRL